MWLRSNTYTDTSLNKNNLDTHIKIYIVDGLFCERIFGPIKSGICACGNYRVIGDKKDQPKFCEQCGVEFVDSREFKKKMLCLNNFSFSLGKC